MLIETQSGEEILGGRFFRRRPLKKSSVSKLLPRMRRFRLFGDGVTWEEALSGFAGTTWEEAALMCGVDIYAPEQYGTWKIFKKIGSVVKSIGKITSPITTKLAKTFLPSSIVDAAAHLDPTKKGNVTPAAVAAVKTLVSAKQAEVPALTPAQMTPSAIQKTAILDTLKNPLVIGVAVAGVGIIVLMATKRR
jgi:hypothetical protein